MTTSPSRALRRYKVFGLEIDSELALPDLFNGEAVAPADVTITLEKVPTADDLPPGPHVSDDGILLLVEGVGRYLVSAGSRIAVEPLSGTSDRNLRLFLLGSAFGILLHQRGLLPLHANAVEIDGKAVAFMGEPGAGKSTLAAWLHDHGYRLLADDVCVVDFHDDGVRAYPGLPRLRLWKDALEASGREPSDFPLSFEGDSTYDKRDVPLALEHVVTQPRELAAVVLLSRSSERFGRLVGAAAVEAVFANTYRGAFVPLTDSARDHWGAAVSLVQSVPVFCWGGEYGAGGRDGFYESLLAEVRKSIAANGQMTTTATATRIP